MQFACYSLFSHNYTEGDSWNVEFAKSIISWIHVRINIDGAFALNTNLTDTCCTRYISGKIWDSEVASSGHFHKHTWIAFPYLSNGIQHLRVISYMFISYFVYLKRKKDLALTVMWCFVYWDTKLQNTILLTISQNPLSLKFYG